MTCNCDYALGCPGGEKAVFRLVRWSEKVYLGNPPFFEDRGQIVVWYRPLLLYAYNLAQVVC